MNNMNASEIRLTVRRTIGKNLHRSIGRVLTNKIFDKESAHGNVINIGKRS